ncbi:hypothetical protein AB2B41_21215 [Marimonas sp. MJW-29]|uniref:Transposase n=1 Tax=Sulfitobacter sediminis TaxID=3234186 RepID=A0ABV3RT11_9RHOB
MKLSTSNPLERIMREIRRRTRLIGAFPDGEVLPEPGFGPTTSHRGHPMVHPKVHECDTAIRGSNPRSRRHLKSKVRKIFDTNNCYGGIGHAMRLSSRCNGARNWPSFYPL